MKNQSYVYTGPGTPAGQYLLRHWLPVFESAKLAPAEAFSLRVMHEDYTIYRGETGTAHMVGSACPHRGTVLSTGWVEGDSIRCFYHGWKFNPEGQCEEQPAEPKQFCHKVKIAGFPTIEQLGLVFVYLGEGEPPPLPEWPEFQEKSVASIAELPCNYFQSAENIMDDVHVGFTHRGLPELSGSNRGFELPLVAAEETSFGLTASFITKDIGERNHWIMPNICCVAYDLVMKLGREKTMTSRAKTLFWYVPIDDYSHYHVMVTAPGSVSILREMKREYAEPHSVTAQVINVLDGKSNVHKGIPDPGTNKIHNIVRTQDAVAIVGQGPIADRDAEQLGASDAGIVLLRRIWLRQLKKLSNDEALTDYRRPDDLLSLLTKIE